MSANERRLMLKRRCEMEPVVNAVRLETYVRMAKQVLRQANSYVESGNLDQSYIFLTRFCRLCVNIMPEHNGYRLAQYRKDVHWSREAAKKAFATLEAINKRMDDEEDLRMVDVNRRDMESRLQALSGELRIPQAPAPAPEPVPVAEPEPAPAQEAPSAPPLPEAEPLPGMSAEAAALAAGTLGSMSAEEAARALRALGLGGAGTISTGTASVAALATGQEFPGVPSMADRPPAPVPAGAAPMPPMPMPMPMPTPMPMPAPMPGPAPAAGPAYPSAAAVAASSNDIPVPSRDELRQMVLPAGSLQRFADIAAPNTHRGPEGIETCAILAGVLRDDMLVMTHLVVPSQEGGANQCSMTREEELFEFMESEDLLLLGWIHTHPSQTCFLSSIDLHTHCGFQTMLREAVAIVLAPTDQNKNVGVFRLTEPHGLKLIQRCDLRGFHPHPSNVEIYGDAGSLHWDGGLPLRVVDLRR